MSRADESFTKTFDVVCVFVLSITAVLTAWCGFEASKWGGEMSIAFSQASGARIQSTAEESRANAARQYDLTIYTEWVRAVQDDRDELRTFIEDRFTPEFRVAFDAWNADGRQALGPFRMEQYVPPGTNEAAVLNKRADDRFEAALVHNQRGDNYALLTVLFALVLFLTALSQRDIATRMRRVLLMLAIAIGLAGVAVMLTFPIKI
ncbi:hypothetical protein IDH50_12905 [Aeromicrobium tamlense]|uniref:DUF4337 domain-containing protein n=1 Tax=Aeromicrobium tamlense TaxID=375541 RepID=A0A8I0G071_9ACTN|nr:hypothetical protein [Aeromicrobium tamlense]MBD1270731.1 hypothetical protein [Aeromicrobium tamlense]MBD1271137.1 hypothetical protein [Aeromicrobium tamlense]NYI38123.1 hypothetical protein [Aeromicrobium tamlense]